MGSSKYEDLGVSATKNGLHAALKASGHGGSHSYFAKLAPDLAGDAEYRSFLHSDGAGTKSIVAYLLYRETGDASVFRGLAQDSLVMNLDDVFCVGLPEKLLLSNQIARNAKLVDDRVVTEILRGYAELAELLRRHGIEIELAGGETADCGDVVRTVLVDSVLGGRIHQARLISTDNISPGDLIVGLSSTGQTTYESAPNSGIGSNGLTLARHALLSRYHPERYPEVVAPEMDAASTYQGPYRITDRVPELGGSIGSALASPTRTYAPVLRAIYLELGAAAVHGAIHNTGGGQTKVIRFGKNCAYHKTDLFAVPPIFSLIQEKAAVPRREMYQVFNMGHRLELYLPRLAAERVSAIARNFNLDARIVGHVERSETNAVHLHAGAERLIYP